MKLHKSISLMVLLVALFSAFQSTGQSCTTTRPLPCPGFKTYTQGGWGATACGNNAGTILTANFAAAFPAPLYLTIGCTNKLVLNSATAVRNFLPSGTTPYMLPAGTKTNPTRTTYSNALAGQLVALALNLRFDLTFPSFGSSSTNLKDLVISTGPFAGKTVQFLYDNANLLIGGCTAFNKTLSEYTTAIDNVNKSYDGGVASGNYVVCPVQITGTVVNATCFGSANGSITLQTTNTQGTVSYLWSNGATTKNISGLVSGTYTVTVTDNYQVTTKSFTVSQPALLVASASSGSISCNGGTTTISVSATGGTSPYTGTGTFTVAAGPYAYTVTDSKGCSASTSGTVTQPAVLTGSASASAIACYGGTSTVAVTASGGTAPYTGIGNYTQTVGSYTYSITDSKGCTTTTSVTITEPTLLTASASAGTISCYGGSTSVTVTATGGTTPYSGTGSFTESAGSHSYSVTDANGCTATASVTITQPTLLTASASAGTIACHGGTTTVDVTAAGGTTPYTGTGSFTKSAGTYTFDITDANGCTASASVTISEPAALQLSLSIQVPTYCSTNDDNGNDTSDNSGGDNGGLNPLDAAAADSAALPSGSENGGGDDNGGGCNGGDDNNNNTCNGTATVTVTGGTGNYTYVWSNGQTTATATGLCGDEPITVTVTDENGCSATISDSVHFAAPLVAELIVTSPATCGTDNDGYNDSGLNPAEVTNPSGDSGGCGDQDLGSCDGTAVVNVSGGVGPYTYLWSNGATTASVSELCGAEVVAVTITDANGCHVSVSQAVSCGDGCDSRMAKPNVSPLSIKRVYPMPGKDHFTVEMAGNVGDDANFQFVDLTGRNITSAFNVTKLSNKEFYVEVAGAMHQIVLMTVRTSGSMQSLPITLQ